MVVAGAGRVSRDPRVRSGCFGALESLQRGHELGCEERADANARKVVQIEALKG